MDRKSAPFSRTTRLLAWGMAITLSAGIVASFTACGTTQRLAMPITEMVLADAVMRLPAEDGDRFIVLTIDDGPSAQTEAILDILSAHDVRATFFIHTDHIRDEGTELAMQRMEAAGHDIANHLPKDQSYGGVPPEDFAAALRDADEALRPYGTAYRRYLRPPQGAYHSGRMDPALAALGYSQPLAPLGSDRRYVMASFIPWDARRGMTDTDDAALNAKRSTRYTDQLLANLYPGAIVLFHDGDGSGTLTRVTATLPSLDRFLADAKAQGYEVLSLSEGISRLTSEAH